MGYLLGVDLGTSSVKALILTEDEGQVIGLAQEPYDYAIRDGIRAEQDPFILREKSLKAIRRVLAQCEVAGTEITAVSTSGQMHGTVLFYRSGEVLKNIITWEDQRCTKHLLSEMRERGGELLRLSGSGLATGYSAATLYYFLRCEPQIYEKAAKFLLPGDWLRNALTSETHYATAPSNACSTGLFDTERCQWNMALVERLGLDQACFPEVLPETEAIGFISSQTASETGLRAGIPVGTGGGDQQLGMLGSGIATESGGLLVNIGTGGQVAKKVSAYRHDPGLITNSFPGGGFALLGAALAGGGALKWWRKVVSGAAEMLVGSDSVADCLSQSYARMSAAASMVSCGSGGLVFVPYLSGTRTSPDIRGSFLGLSAGHTLAEMTRAVMEGVVFELKLLYDRFAGPADTQIVGAGGGLSSPVWAQIVADVFDREIRLTICPEQAALGAALLAGVTSGAFSTLKEATSVVKFKDEIVRPVPEHTRVYQELLEHARISFEEGNNNK